MRAYDPSQPLIVIHVPKAGGVSSRQFFQKWFGEGYLRHYFNEQTGGLPAKYDLFGRHSIEQPVVLHGHFNRLRRFGVEDYYPEVKQFITILRDPFELTLSHYFYTRKLSDRFKDQSLIPVEDLADHLTRAKPNMLNHFPRAITPDNYKEIIETYFIEIGITEQLHASMRRIAQKLNQDFDETLLGHYNATDRDQEVPRYLKDIFKENNPLEFDVYEYALQKFSQQEATPSGDQPGAPPAGKSYPPR